jgi:hypothetical protein
VNTVRVPTPLSPRERCGLGRSPPPHHPVGVRSPERGSVNTRKNSWSRGIFKFTGLSPELSRYPQVSYGRPPVAHRSCTAMCTAIEIFDTTLRDGLQVEGVSATVEDKLRIAEQLDYLGVHFIEGGWPGANPKDIEFFARAARELDLTTSTFVAFGSTRRPRGKVDEDQTLQHLLDANTSAVCIVAKSWDYHVTEALKTTLDEGAAMIADSVEFLHGHGRRCSSTWSTSSTASRRTRSSRSGPSKRRAPKGASHVVLCDTNGGSLPHEVGQTSSARSRARRRRRHDRHPLPRRHRLRGRQLDGGRPRRRPSRAGHPQRARRADRQRQPHLDHPEPPAQAGLRVPARGSHGATDGRVAPGRRAAQSGGQPAGAVRRLVGVRAQGRAPRERDRSGQGRLRARRPEASATAPGSSCRRWPARPRSR